ncbi:hypothetical protein OKW11_005616 [Pseudomonas baetica]|nr:hypothetical protein [Pseudomonas baetica]
MMGEDFWSSLFAFWLLVGPILLGCVSIAFTLYLSRHHLDASEDIENFPPHLKRLLVIYVVGVTVTLIGMAITYVLLKSR